MERDEMISTLEGYHRELDAILSRFKKTSDSISIDRKDDARYREVGAGVEGFVQ